MEVNDKVAKLFSYQIAQEAQELMRALNKKDVSVEEIESILGMSVIQ